MDDYLQKVRKKTDLRNGKQSRTIILGQASIRLKIYH